MTAAVSLISADDKHLDIRVDVMLVDYSIAKSLGFWREDGDTYPVYQPKIEKGFRCLYFNSYERIRFSQNYHGCDFGAVLKATYENYNEGGIWKRVYQGRRGEYLLAYE